MLSRSVRLPYLSGLPSENKGTSDNWGHGTYSFAVVFFGAMTRDCTELELREKKTTKSAMAPKADSAVPK